jgi:hypothetical protein
MKQLYIPALFRLPRLPLGPEKERVSVYPFERHMDQVYLPAILPTTLYDKWDLHPINWMDPRLRGTEVYYPYALLSFYHWRSARTVFEDDSHIFGDSGGYSVATLGANIDSPEALRWQLRNCHLGVILDVPPYISVGSAVLGGAAASNWEEALEKSVRNTQQALPVYLKAKDEGHPFKWWGVVHGETHEQMSEWYGRIREVYPFEEDGEGWAMKPHPANDPRSLARCLRFVKSVGIKRAHFLQMTGLPAVTTLFALGPRAGLEYATYDSATPSFSGINRTIFRVSDDGLSFKTIVEKFRETGGVDTKARDFMRDECQCPSCQFLRKDLEVRPEVDEEYWKYRMIFHNTTTLVSLLARRFEATQADPDGLLRRALGRVPEGLLAPEGEQKKTGRKRNLYGATLRAFEGQEAHSVSLGTPVDLLDWVK